LLKYAIYSVINQDYDNWEIIISDNYSEEKIFEYVASLKDPRIKYFRTHAFIPVTENWNNALEKSSGDYVIMLGDDDCLMKGYFTTVIKLIKEFSPFDFLYTGGFMYAYPGVYPNYPEGFFQLFINATFFKSKRQAFWLNYPETASAIESSLNFKNHFAFNMQYALISRKFINLLSKNMPFFQSPYPDFYAMLAMMLNAKKILIYPFPIVTVGISKKSFGFYFVNNLETDGIKFLNNSSLSRITDSLKSSLLPGSEHYSNWLFAMEQLKLNYKQQFHLKINYRRYRLLQTIVAFRKWISKQKHSHAILLDTWKRLTFLEKLSYGYVFYCGACWLRFMSNKYNRKLGKFFIKLLRINDSLRHYEINQKHTNIKEIFDNIDPNNFKRN
jgi:glycosyltransferase involved in cell wall biosynthesis